MKKLISVLSIIFLALSLVACKSSASNEDGTYTGKITSIDDKSITLALGEISENEMQGGGTPPDMNSNGNEGSNPGGSAPEKPDGDSTDSSNQPSQPADNSNGNDGSNQNGAPEKPSGDTTSSDSTEGTNGQGGPGMNNDNGGSNQGGTPPEKPDGESSDMGSNQNGGNVPSGDPGQNDGTAPDMGSMTRYTFTENGETLTLTLTFSDDISDTISGLSVDDVVTIVVEDGTITSVETTEISDGNFEPGDMGGSSSGTVDQGTSANTVDSDVDGESYTSTGDSENALRVDGSTVTLSNITVNKESGSVDSPESGDFYGINAALLATNGANVTITGATINSSAQCGNGVFSYGSGTVVNISDSTITTTADNSGGIQTTGGGTTNASNLTINTSGNSSAAIRSDRGGGTVNVSGGTYTSNGYNSPAVYSTADITVSDATLTANNSEALVIEGENTIDLTDCDVYGNMSDDKGTSSSENVHSVMIYQSMSGDAEVGEATFNMTNGTLTSNNGDVIYVTNTDATITLTNVTIVNNETDGYLLRVVGNSRWGNTGANGASVVFTCNKQTLDGDILVDTISKLNMTLSNNSAFTGTINITENTSATSSVDDNVTVTIEAGSTWNLTGDCTISTLINSGTINYNGYTITLADGTVLSD